MKLWMILGVILAQKVGDAKKCLDGFPLTSACVMLQNGSLEQ